jgi:uncharacterized protein (DUF302 family)
MLRLLITVAVLWTAQAVAGTWAPQPLEMASRQGFSETLEDLEFAITERNLRITGRNDIGEAVRAEGTAGFPNVVVLHYCSLAIAREALALDPAFIVPMTCRISVYERDGAVYLGALLLPENGPHATLNTLAVRLNAMVVEILRFAAGEGH